VHAFGRVVIINMVEAAALANATINGTFQSTAPIVTLASFSFPLTFLYFALATLAAVSIGRVLFFRHKFLSFQGGFLSLSLVWSLVRAVLLLFTDLVRMRAPAMFRLLLWLPEVFQMATFSLLVVFYGSILHSKSKRLYLIMYSIGNVLFLAAHIIVYSVVVKQSTRVPPFAEAVIDAFSFGSLAVLLAVWGAWLWHRLGDSDRGIPALASLGRGSSRLKMGMFVIFVVVILLSRALVELLLALRAITFEAFGSTAGFSWQGGMWFLAFVVWEVIPIFIFITSYWPAATGSSHSALRYRPISSTSLSINADPSAASAAAASSSSASSSAAAGGSLPHERKRSSVTIREAEPLVASNLFSNVGRYDSDGDDDAPFETASGSLYSPYFTNSPNLRSHLK